MFSKGYGSAFKPDAGREPAGVGVEVQTLGAVQMESILAGRPFSQTALPGTRPCRRTRLNREMALSLHHGTSPPYNERRAP